MRNISRHKAIWSYSIYGNDADTYYKPIIRNIHLARQQGALVAISTRSNEEKRVRYFFKDYKNEIAILTYHNPALCKHPKILRFLVSGALDADFYFFKDSDSVVTDKELGIMKEWMALSASKALIIRDHPLHVAPIMAGMFGVSSGTAGIVRKSAQVSFQVDCSKFRNAYSYDQDWLMSDVYPLLVKYATVYTSFLYYSGENVRRIERETNGFGFIGAQKHYRYAQQSDKAPFLAWYAGGLLCAPSFLKKFRFYARVRPTIIFAYIYTKLKKALRIN